MTEICGQTGSTHHSYPWVSNSNAARREAAVTEISLIFHIYCTRIASEFFYIRSLFCYTYL